MRVVVLIQAPRGAPADDEPRKLDGLPPCERAALALASKLAGDEGSVTALTAGPREDERVFAHARALGASRCVRVTETAVDWDNLDSVSALLAQALEEIGFDVVLAGDRSANWSSGMTGPVVAHRLGVPHLRCVIDVEHAPAADLPLETVQTDDENAALEHGRAFEARQDTIDSSDDDGGFGDEEPTVADNIALRASRSGEHRAVGGHDDDDDEDDGGGDGDALSPTDTVADDGAGGLAHVDTGEQALASGKTVASMNMPTLPPDTASLRQHTTAGPPLAVSVQHGARLLRVTLPSPLVLTALGCRPYEALTTEAAAAVAQAEPSVELLDLSDADADGSATSTTLRAPKTLASAIADVRPSLSRIERRAEIVADVPALIGKLRALGVLGPAS